jgi:hypothetical protein
MGIILLTSHRTNPATIITSKMVRSDIKMVLRVGSKVIA